MEIYATGFAHMAGRIRWHHEMKRRLCRAIFWMLRAHHLPNPVREHALKQMMLLTRMVFGRNWSPFMGGSISNTFENDLIKLIFTATAIANIADNAATAPLTNLYYALHVGDPGEAGTQTTNEATYTSYDRVAVLRNGTGHTVTNNSVSPASNISFPAGTGGSGTVDYFSVGTDDLPTAGKILFSGTVTPNIVTGDGITPILTTATAITLD